ncbi:MAG: hypothetical protein DRO12_00565 [Thermoprotei archaeon]|nr:MAG: hypothetical protein DRO12_00565 [Thermoprotei archaeon]
MNNYDQKDIVIRLSGEHVDLALAELTSVLESLGIDQRFVRIDEIVILHNVRHAMLRKIVERAAFIKEVGELIAITKADVSELCQLLRSVGISLERARFTCIRGFGREIAKKLRAFCETSDGEEAQVYLVGNVAVIAKPIYKRSLSKTFEVRAPHVRPVYRPGAMKPHLARLYVNLAALSEGGVLLDPFCGVGGFLLEACHAGLTSIGIDIDGACVKGARTNSEHYGCGWCVDVVQGDASMIPLRSNSVNGVSTDPPYGRQARALAASLIELIKKFLIESCRVVANGRIVFAVPLDIEFAIDNFVKAMRVSIWSKHIDWVHGSLTRVVYVVKCGETQDNIPRYWSLSTL